MAAGRRLPLHNVIKIYPVCPARSRFLPLRTSHLAGEHGRKPEQLFWLNIEPDAVGMAAFADVGMEIPVMTQVIENIRHQIRFDAAECDVAQLVPVTSEVSDHEHLIVSFAPDIAVLLPVIMEGPSKEIHSQNSHFQMVYCTTGHQVSEENRTVLVRRSEFKVAPRLRNTG